MDLFLSQQSIDSGKHTAVRGAPKQRMNNVWRAALTVAACLVAVASGRSQGTAFTYQGRLNVGGTPANGSYDLTFIVYDAAIGGNLAGGPITNALTSVSNGLFTATLDFGPGVFTGPAMWLELGVRSNASGAAFAILSPRQPLTAAPYAITAGNISSATVARLDTANAFVNSNYFSGPDTFAAPAFFEGSLTASNATGAAVAGETGTGYGVFGQATVAGGWGGLFRFGIDGNHSAYLGSSTLAGDFYGNVVFRNNVGIGMSAPQARLDVRTGTGGGDGGFWMGSGPSIWGESQSGVGVVGSSVATSGYGVYGNVYGSNSIAVMGIAYANSTATYGLYGVSYSPSGYGIYGASTTNGVAVYGQTYGNGTAIIGSTTSGIGVDGVSSSGTGVAGSSTGGTGVSGSSSSGSGVSGSAPTGNGVAGSTTTGYGVFGQSSGSGFGGLFRYGYDGNNSAYLGGNGNAAVFYGTVTVNGTFNNSSDRDAKQDLTSVSSTDLLAKVAQLPITEWSYKQDTKTRHVGPMAQDFHAAFGLGTDERHIAPLDEAGVALAAIQALNQKVEALEHQNAELKARLDRAERHLHGGADQ